MTNHNHLLYTRFSLKKCCDANPIFLGRPVYASVNQLDNDFFILWVSTMSVGTVDSVFHYHERWLDPDSKGQQLQQFYLSMDVENRWIAGSHVNWETGEYDKPDATSGNHTHCSAFVSACCKKMGIYILRPPDHGQKLLANAQYEWLSSPEAKSKG